MTLTKEQEIWISIPQEKRADIITTAVREAIAKAVEEHGKEEQTSAEESCGQKDDSA